MIFLFLLLVFSFGKNNSAIYYLNAQAALDEGNYDLAEDYIEKALKENPDSEFLKVELAKVLTFKGHYPDAQKFLESFNPKNGEKQDYYSLKFYLDLMLDDINGALQDYKIIKDSDLSKENLTFIVEAIQTKIMKYLSEESPENSIKLLEIYLRFFPHEEEIQKALINLYMETGDIEKANPLIKNFEINEKTYPIISNYFSYLFEKNDCKSILEMKDKFLDTNYEKLLSIYNYCFIRNGSIKEVNDIINKVLNSNPDNFWALTLLLEIKLIDGEYEEAKKILEKLPRENEEQVNFIRENEALLYQLKGEYKLAEQVYFKLLEKFESRERIKILKKIYYFYKDIGDCQKILEYSLKILEEDSKDLFSYYRIGEAYLILKDIKNALFYLNYYNEQGGIESMVSSIWLLLEYGFLDEAYSMILEMESKGKKISQINQLWGFYYFKKGEIVEMEKVLEKDGDDPSSLNLHGYFLIEMNEKLDEAISYINRALEQDPSNGSYLDSLGWGYYKKGDYEKAYELIRRSIFLETFNGIILSHLGDVCMELKNYREALLRYKQALSFQEPEMPDILKKLIEALILDRKNFNSKKRK